METITDEQYIILCNQKFRNSVKNYNFSENLLFYYMGALINKYQNNCEMCDLNVLIFLKDKCSTIISKDEYSMYEINNCALNLKNKYIWKDILLFFNDDALKNAEKNDIITKIHDLENRVSHIEKNN